MPQDMMYLGRYGSSRAAYVPDMRLPRSAFDRSSTKKLTYNAGELIPVRVDEILPGDTVKLQMRAFARLSTPLFPVMDNVWLSSFWFFVPSRLLWDNWVKLNGEQTNPGDTTDYLTPICAAPAGTGYANGSLQDYMGLPTEVADFVHQSMPLRAYNFIWDSWFRDQNLQDSVGFPRDNGPDDPALYTLLRRGKRHDYFTSALPWPQKGTPVDLPIGTSAPVDFVGSPATGHTAADATVRNVVESAAAGRGMELFQASGSSSQVTFDVLGTWTADLSLATAATMNELRVAFQVQALFESDARGGTRYTEILLHQFGVVVPDFRLQRPEYLGGGRTPINIYPVAQTSESAGTPQGTLTGFGTAIAEHGFMRSFPEHGFLIGLICVDADLTYQQGLERFWSRRTRVDHYWPPLAGLGEQEILNKEIYIANVAADDDVFGYQERYGEYRFPPMQRISGQFRSNFATSLDAWILTEDFAALPVLNGDFIESDPPLARVLATAASYPQMIQDTEFRESWARRMPLFGVPAQLMRF